MGDLSIFSTDNNFDQRYCFVDKMLTDYFNTHKICRKVAQKKNLRKNLRFVQKLNLLHEANFVKFSVITELGNALGD